MVKFGTPSQGRDPLAYVDSRLSGVPTVQGPRDPTVNDNTFPIQTIWRNSVTFKECMLVGFSGGEAVWRCFTDAEGSVLELKADDGNLVQPAAGVITVAGLAVANAANAKPLFTDGVTANILTLEIQVGAAVAAAPGDKLDAGLFSVDSSQFTSDPDGWLQLKNNSSENTVQTTDATPTTLGTLAVADNTSVVIKGLIIAQEDDFSNRIGGEFLAVASASGGAASIETAIITNEISTFSTATFSVVASAGNLVVQVTGEAATTVDWKGTWNYVIEG